MRLAVSAAVGRRKRNRLIPPSGITGPAWAAGLALNTWREIAGTRLDLAQSGFTSPGGLKQYVTAYSGMSVKKSTSELWLLGGGHNDYAGNEPYSLLLSADAPAWVRRRDPSSSVTATASHNPDGRPASRHTYWHVQFIESRNRLMTIGGAAYYGPTGGDNYPNVDAFNPDTNDWEPANTYASGPSGFQSVGQAMCQAGNDDVWVQNPNGTGTMYRWNAATATFTEIGMRSTYDHDTPMAYDSLRNRLVRFGDSGQARRFDLNNDAAETSITFGGSQAAQAGRGSSVEYVPDLDRFLIMPWQSDTIYQCHPTTFAVEEYAVAGTKPPGSPADGTGNLYGRFAHCPALKLMAYVRSVSDNVWVFQYGTP